MHSVRECNLFNFKEVMIEIGSIQTSANATSETFLLHLDPRQSLLSEFVLLSGKIYPENQARMTTENRAWK